MAWIAARLSAAGARCFIGGIVVQLGLCSAVLVAGLRLQAPAPNPPAVKSAPGFTAHCVELSMINGEAAR